MITGLVHHTIKAFSVADPLTPSMEALGSAESLDRTLMCLFSRRGRAGDNPQKISETDRPPKLSLV